MRRVFFFKSRNCDLVCEMLFSWSSFSLLFSPKSKVLLVFFMLSLIVKTRLDLKSRVQVTVCDEPLTSAEDESGEGCRWGWFVLHKMIKLCLWVSVKETRRLVRTRRNGRLFWCQGLTARDPGREIPTWGFPRRVCSGAKFKLTITDRVRYSSPLFPLRACYIPPRALCR